MNKTVNDYYAAYGSNLNHQQMHQRCPAAERVETATLENWQLVFRGVADIIPVVGSSVPVGVYRITNTCEDALDHYENYPKLYRKEHLSLRFDRKILRVKTYIMNPGYGYGVPSQGYFDVIRTGYKNWQLPYAALTESLRHALKNHSKSAYKSPRWAHPPFIDTIRGNALITDLENNP